MIGVEGLRVAVAQVGYTIGNTVGNILTAQRYVRMAARRGARLIVFPECFIQGYSVRSSVLAGAEPRSGPGISALRSLAEQHQSAIVAGFVETNPRDRDRPFNAAAVIDCYGRLVGVYRKTHLFESEHAAFAAGRSYPVFHVRTRTDRPPIRLGVAICADIEYPEVIRILALSGAQLIAVPSADMEPYRAQQAANLASRAIENSLFVALANTIGSHDGLEFFGGSGVAGPAGSLVSAGYRRPRLAIAELSLVELDRSGGFGAYLSTRRPATYGALVRQSSAGASERDQLD